MNPYYNQNYTREEIQNVLDKIKKLVFRQENIPFL